MQEGKWIIQYNYCPPNQVIDPEKDFTPIINAVEKKTYIDDAKQANTDSVVDTVMGAYVIAVRHRVLFNCYSIAEYSIWVQ